MQNVLGFVLLGDDQLVPTVCADNMNTSEPRAVKKKTRTMC